MSISTAQRLEAAEVRARGQDLGYDPRHIIIATGRAETADHPVTLHGASHDQAKLRRFAATPQYRLQAEALVRAQTAAVIVSPR